MNLVRLSAAACLSYVAWQWWTPTAAPAPRLIASGIGTVKEPSFDALDAALAKAAPSWGQERRARVAHAIAEEALRNDFDPMLVMAIISVESEFREDAVSDQGAQGLMQLQGPTAREVAARAGLRLSQTEIESDPSLNVRMGVKYLKHLVDRFDGDLDLALIAYNVGPAQARQLLRHGALDSKRYYANAIKRSHLRFASEFALALRAR